MKTTRRVASLAVSAAIVLTLTSCTLPGSNQNSPGSNVNTTAPAPEPGESAPTATTTTSTDAASVAAVEAMTAYVQHHDNETTWWAGLSPYLSPEAAFLIEGTDPAQIPATHLTGAAIATPASSASVSVLVPTDAGQYRLDMTRRGDDGSAGVWVVFGFTAPEGTR